MTDIDTQMLGERCDVEQVPFDLPPQLLRDLVPGQDVVRDLPFGLLLEFFLMLAAAPAACRSARSPPMRPTPRMAAPPCWEV